MSRGAYELVRVPLMEATIEVRFPGDARIDAIRGDFQQAIVEEFPQLFVPEVAPGESPALLPYRFQNLDGTRTVALAINSLAFLAKQYPGWATFKSDFLGFWEKLASRVQLRDLGRVGMRFVNRFDDELNQHLNIEEAPEYLASLRDPKCDFIRSATNYGDGETGLLINVHKPQSEPVLVLDYDAYTHNAKPEAIEATLESLHSRIEAEFQRTLNDDYARTLLSPKAGG